MYRREPKHRLVPLLSSLFVPVPSLDIGHSGPVRRFGWWPHPICSCFRRCSRFVLRRSARRRCRRLRARVAHLPVFRCSRCSRCRWCPVRAESEALGGVFPVVPGFLLFLGRSTTAAWFWRPHSRRRRRLRSPHRAFRFRVFRGLDYLSSSRTLTRAFKCRGWRARRRSFVRCSVFRCLIYMRST